ncbi:MAG: gene transfer agent family protein [Pseudomonadota bacterium]|nr:gene transfer agent family protein [Pseudomonadota bacterium]
MANRYRGEIAAELDGRQWTLCLTLGALAELEPVFGAADLADLASRLGSGRLTATQMTAILAAGLRGGGHDVSESEVAAMHCPQGLAGMARIVADLVGATFGAGEPAPRRGNAPANPSRPLED